MGAPERAEQCGYCLKDVPVSREGNLGKHPRGGDGTCPGSRQPVHVWPGQIKKGDVFATSDGSIVTAAGDAVFTRRDNQWRVNDVLLPGDQQFRLWRRA